MGSRGDPSPSGIPGNRSRSSRGAATGASQTPDWAALAEASETRNRRRRLFFIGGGALATVAIGTAVAMAVVSANGDDEANKPTSSLPATADIPSATGTTPSFAPTSAPPPLDPKDFIASKAKDTAPLSADILFPGTQLTMGSTVYKKGADGRHEELRRGRHGPAEPRQGPQGQQLHPLHARHLHQGRRRGHGRRGRLRHRGPGDEGEEPGQHQEGHRQVAVRRRVKAFCNSAICRSTSNSYGRYAYFTIAGFTNGKNVTEKDTAVFSTGDDLAEFTFRQIHRRGEAQASAAANG